MDILINILAVIGLLTIIALMSMNNKNDNNTRIGESFMERMNRIKENEIRLENESEIEYQNRILDMATKESGKTWTY